MTTRATDLVYAQTKYYGSAGVATYQGLTKREYAAAVILNGLLRDADNVGALSDAQLAVIAVARADAALSAAGATGTDMAFPPEEFRKVSLPAAARKTGITKLEEYCINLMSGFQGDNLSIDALNPAPGTITDALAGLGAGLVEHITVPTAPTGALAATPIAGNVNLITVPTAPTSVLAGAGAGNVDSLTVPIAPTAALAGVGAGSVDHIAVPIAPTMVEGAPGNVDIGDHYYVTTYVTADGETLMGAISAVISIAAAAKHVTVTVPISTQTGVLSRNIYRCKVGAAHAVRADFFLAGAIADNVTATFDDNTASAGLGAGNPPATNTAGGFKYVLTFKTVDGESTMGAIQAVAVVVADKTADGKVTVTIPVSAQTGVSDRTIYRCKSGKAATSTLRTHFFKVADVGNNVDVTYVDNIADSALGASPPAANNGAQYKYLVVYEAEDGTQTSIGAIQAAATTVADKTADGKVTVTIPVSAEVGVAKRLVYRSKLGQAKAARTDFFLAATVANNTDVTVTDNVAESGLGANPPAANGTGGHKYIITFETADGETTMGALSAAITVADPAVNGRVELVVAVSAQPGVTKRTIYRSKAGVVPSVRTHFFKVGSIANNTGTAYTDNVADSGLGASPPATNNAGNYTYKVTHISPSGESEAGSASGGVYVSDKAANGKIALSAIPTGPAGTTARNIYRTKCGYGSLGPWYYHSQIADNTTATATDNTPDSGLTVGTTAPSSDTAWAGILAVDIGDKAAKLATQMGSSANDPIIPYRWYVASGAEVRQGLTKEEFFAEAAESGFISDSVNIGVLTNAQLATKGDTLSAALIVALN